MIGGKCGDRRSIQHHPPLLAGIPKRLFDSVFPCGGRRDARGAGDGRGELQRPGAPRSQPL